MLSYGSSLVGGLAGRPEATAVEGVFEEDDFFFGGGLYFAQPGAEFDLDGNVTMRAGPVCHGLLDREPDSTGWAGEGEFDRVGWHDYQSVKVFDVSLTSDLCGKAFHLET